MLNHYIVVLCVTSPLYEAGLGWIVFHRLNCFCRPLLKLAQSSVSNFFSCPKFIKLHVAWECIWSVTNWFATHEDYWASQPDMGEASFHFNFVTHFGFVTFAVLQSFIGGGEQNPVKLAQIKMRISNEIL